MAALQFRPKPVAILPRMSRQFSPVFALTARAGDGKLLAAPLLGGI